MGPKPRIVTLTVATVIAAPLTAVAWWVLQDGDAGNDWLVSAIRAVTATLLSKSGMNVLVGIAVVIGGGIAWVRSRRRSRTGRTASGEQTPSHDSRTAPGRHRS